MSPSNKPTLTYFDAAGRAFAIRAALRSVNYPFADLRTSDLATLRGSAGYNATVPLGQLPTLTLSNGPVGVQTQSILRWACKKAGLLGKTDEEALVSDSVAETTAELLAKAPQHNDKEERIKLRGEYVQKVAPRYLGFLSSVIMASGGPFVLGKSLSMGDLVLYGFEALVDRKDLDGVTWDATVGKYPALVTHFAACKAHPVIANELALEASRKK